ncbi:predicted protein [Nematostella vectensis]|uniref:Uncharacterized protein n=1 Tax=Nematostella vectensis TaxID=45351 RepID=A7S5A8_NEMVE|nr:predicted protein [Nematostella vectensis]|eukprot:XP_001633151.1 predicted protein [Nematostella vectensis]
MCSPQLCTKIWRPWDMEPSENVIRKSTRYQPYRGNERIAPSQPLRQYLNTFKHPVRLYWTKAAYDYMYEAGESLLRNFPVQATIQIAEESDREDQEEEEEEESSSQQQPHRKNDVKST